MYISYVELKNWRSYADCNFEFPAPDPERPLVLVGAMNGHGKTSLLLAFYFGLFGRHGVRYAEGFDLGPDTPRIRHYRQALEEFRRELAPDFEPTEVDITITPSPIDRERDPDGTVELRIVRRWHFSTAGRWKDKEEEVQVYVNGLPQALQHHDDAAGFIERFFVPAHVLPAFFFDGEQAGRRIDLAGESQTREAVQVLYGTKLLDELDDRLRRFVAEQRSRGQLGLKSASTERLRDLRTRRDEVDEELESMERERDELATALDEAKDQITRSQDHLQLLGATSQRELKALREEAEAVALELQETKRRFSDTVTALPLALALAPARDGLRERLETEATLARWELLRSAAAAKIPTILNHLTTAGDLPGDLSDQQRETVSAAVRAALEAGYGDAPPNCAPFQRHVHLDSARRRRLLDTLVEDDNLRADSVRSLASSLIELTSRRQRSVDRADESRHREQVKVAIAELDEAQHQASQRSIALTRADTRLVPLREERKQLRSEIGRLETNLSEMAPFEATLEVAERVRDVLGDFNESLRPLAIARLEAAVGRHFTAIADERYQGAHVRFDDEGRTVLETAHGVRPLRSMSGYERRTFGVAFSLALAEVSGFRAPLVIDTPLGNADSSYRSSLLEHLVQAGLDQIIILTHDEEVVGRYHDGIRDRVNEHYLIENRTTDGSEANRESVVTRGAYFTR